MLSPTRTEILIFVSRLQGNHATNYVIDTKDPAIYAAYILLEFTRVSR